MPTLLFLESKPASRSKSAIMKTTIRKLLSTGYDLLPPIYLSLHIRIEYCVLCVAREHTAQETSDFCLWQNFDITFMFLRIKIQRNMGGEGN